MLCGWLSAVSLATGQNWQDALAQMQMPPTAPALNRSNCIPAMLRAFQPDRTVKALVFLPGVADDFYLIHRDAPPLNLQAHTLLEAVAALTNTTAVRVTFRAPLLLLHLDRDSVDPAFSTKSRSTADRLAGQHSLPQALFVDRPWDTLQPELKNAFRLNFQPKIKSPEAQHLIRVNLAGWHLTDWEWLTALALSSRTTCRVSRNRVSFEPNAGPL
jgi:hypothetical protein